MRLLMGTDGVRSLENVGVTEGTEKGSGLSPLD